MTVMTCQTAAMVQAPSVTPSLKDRYHALLEGQDTSSRAWLDAQLDQARDMPDDLPDDPAQLDAWSLQHAAGVAEGYKAYLEQRKQGGPRRYFANRAQALWFLQQVEPTKVVDGAWLFSALRKWRDPRYHGLIRTYLEELGSGDPRCNHVLIYQRLMSRLGCLDRPNLDDARYLQASLQLALGEYGQDYLPEVIGYNLGYEQPPLHLLITTYELAELGIDGFYFQLHVTIDNAASGHAHLSLQALRQLCPADNVAGFYERVRRGYRLNDLGTSTPALIASFDLEAELLQALEHKRNFGQFMHSDHCRLQKRTINQWLAEPGAMPDFLDAMQVQGWIRRGEAPEQSRWWKLIEGPTAPMYGVFTAYEKQLWHDWIAAGSQSRIRRVLPGSWEAALQLQDQTPGNRRSCAADYDIDALICAMSGNKHATPEGLVATQAYIQSTGLLQEGSH
ncbi:iron-containing redox enzyme family protein [Pseudomonas fulva]|uniref:iron-containing redox enzyme family protein n=1 Tax=Pseudomonas fulva TaxID=47880 RepID=UPI0018AB008D|nr:iron-containing redox enzyme family protein [Pseudomonas fulva]MBF8674136.1 iron-containing redox enzyme family protein [Pseudomonas fulva]MBF8695795.1 iron-containing redox enzyme family protein [Pseudomonas fulva]